MGWICYKRGENEKAESTFRKILDKNPKNFQARYFLAATLIEEGRKEEAKEELTYILEESSKEEIAYNLSLIHI